MNFMTKLLVKRKPLSAGIIKLIAFAFLSLLIYSCAKSPKKIGANIMPEDSKLNVARTDTTSVYAYSVLSDSVRSDELSFNYFGSLLDPKFGTVTAGIYTQLSITSVDHDFGPNPVLDSLVLQMAYQGYYGDTNVSLTFHAYELTELMEFDNEYYSNLELQHDFIDYGNYTFEPHPNDSTTEIDTIANDTIRIGAVEKFNLGLTNTTLANKLLNADSATMSSSENFRNYFKGLYLTVSEVNSDGCLIRFNLNDTKSGLILYYKNDTADSLRYGYMASSVTPRVGKYTHNYSTASQEIQNQVINGDTSLGQQKFYVQGLAGLKGVIKFPHLLDWARKGKYAFNEVKLIFSGYESEPYLDAPAALFLVKRNADNTQEILEDQYQGASYFDGEYKSSTNEYVFRITNHIQNLLIDTTQVDYGLYVYANGSSLNPKRFVFNGNEPESDTLSPFRLEIIYTDLNQK